MTDEGDIIIDFSLYDAVQAGFGECVFIIKENMEADVRSIIDPGAGRHIRARYAFQRQDDLPPGFAAPEGREKPWGTSHAVWSARELIDGPFAVINADDYYGAEAFRLMYERLSRTDVPPNHHAMVAYVLDNTLTDSGAVARGVCEVDGEGFLATVVERKKVMRRRGGVYYQEADGEWTPVRADSAASMNFWGFMPGILGEIEAGFPRFFEKALPGDPQGAEYLLPNLVDELIKAHKARVSVMQSNSQWYGVTYKEDKQAVRAAMREMKRRGLYPGRLWA
jgi:NDP-sugar pyrophosphorylase family protein